MPKKTQELKQSLEKRKVDKVINRYIKPKKVVVPYMGKQWEVILNCPFDARGLNTDDVLEVYRTIHLGRRLDEKAALYVKMAKGWSYHAPFGGHDGIQYGLGKIFRRKHDFLFPYYRDMLTCLTAGLTVEEIILNGLSKEDDIAGGGRHMSNHFAKVEYNIQNVSSCTGNHAQHAAGLARAVKKYKSEAVVYYSGGESASSEGYFWEALNCATLEKLPVIFVVQNNKFAISVPIYEQTANAQISDNYAGFKNLKIFNCNGRCPFNSYNTLLEAREYVMTGAGPAMVHADCDRMGSHSNSDPHTLYRTEDEIKQAAKRDPFLQLRYTILYERIATEQELQKIEDENNQIIQETSARVEAMPDADGNKWNMFIMPEPLAKKGDNTEKKAPDDAPSVTLREGINLAMKEEFRRNPNTFMWGQDVASKDKGGIFNVCKGMLQEFGNDRVFNSPIAENNIVGAANGFSRFSKDIWVCIEGAEFADYFWPAMDQLLECSHDYWRTKGQFAPNVVIRLASGGYIQGGLYHSQNLEGTFTTIPGIRVVSPAFADDAIGLMRNAMRSRGTTMYLEPKFLYNYRPASSPLPPDDHIVPFGVGKIRREGSDITVVSYGTAVHLALQAAKALENDGISVEVVDLRSLAPWDKDIVIESVKKTGRAVVAHEDKVTGGFGGEIAGAIASEAFTYLDAPVLRIGSKDVPVGFAKNYETAILPSMEEVKSALLKTVRF